MKHNLLIGCTLGTIATGIGILLRYLIIKSANDRNERKEAFKYYKDVRDELPMDFELQEMSDSDPFDYRIHIPSEQEIKEYIFSKRHSKK